LDTFKDWNLTLGTKLINVPGRVLPFESISSNNSQYNGGPEAGWSQHTSSLPMYTSVVMNFWVIITPIIVAQEINAFVAALQKVGNKMSFSLSNPEM